MYETVLTVATSCLSITEDPAAGCRIQWEHSERGDFTYARLIK
jgi:hypothetical protein